eukprot:5191919-Pyramimonas_sp.AAC.2
MSPLCFGTARSCAVWPAFDLAVSNLFLYTSFACSSMPGTTKQATREFKDCFTVSSHALDTALTWPALLDKGVFPR